MQVDLESQLHMFDPSVFLLVFPFRQRESNFPPPRQSLHPPLQPKHATITHNLFDACESFMTLYGGVSPVCFHFFVTLQIDFFLFLHTVLLFCTLSLSYSETPSQVQKKWIEERKKQSERKKERKQSPITLSVRRMLHGKTLNESKNFVFQGTSISL